MSPALSTHSLIKTRVCICHPHIRIYLGVRRHAGVGVNVDYDIAMRRLVLVADHSRHPGRWGWQEWFDGCCKCTTPITQTNTHRHTKTLLLLGPVLNPPTHLSTPLPKICIPFHRHPRKYTQTHITTNHTKHVRRQVLHRLGIIIDTLRFRAHQINRQ